MDTICEEKEHLSDSEEDSLLSRNECRPVSICKLYEEKMENPHLEYKPEIKTDKPVQSIAPKRQIMVVKQYKNLQDLPNDSFEVFNVSCFELCFSNTFNENIDGLVIPPYIRKIHFGFSFNRSINNVIFHDDIEELQFGYSFNQSFEGFKFPKNLKRLILGYSYSQSLSMLEFPNLHLLSIYTLSEDLLNLPSTLQTLRVCYLKKEQTHLPVGIKKCLFESEDQIEQILKTNVPLGCNIFVNHNFYDY